MSTRTETCKCGEPVDTVPCRECLEARVAELQAALRPFADDLERWNNYDSGLTYLDLERAREVLARDSA